MGNEGHKGRCMSLFLRHKYAARIHHPCGKYKQAYVRFLRLLTLNIGGVLLLLFIVNKKDIWEICVNYLERPPVLAYTCRTIFSKL